MCYLEIFICQLTLYSVVILFVSIVNMFHIHRYVTDLTEASFAAAERVLSKTTEVHLKRKPGWDEFVTSDRRNRGMTSGPMLDVLGLVY